MHTVAELSQLTLW